MFRRPHSSTKRLWPSLRGGGERKIANHHQGPQMYLGRWAVMGSSSQFRSTPVRCIVRNRPTRCA